MLAGGEQISAEAEQDFFHLLLIARLGVVLALAELGGAERGIDGQQIEAARLEPHKEAIVLVWSHPCYLRIGYEPNPPIIGTSR